MSTDSACRVIWMEKINILFYENPATAKRVPSFVMQTSSVRVASAKVAAAFGEAFIESISIFSRLLNFHSALVLVCRFDCD